VDPPYLTFGAGGYQPPSTEAITVLAQWWVRLLLLNFTMMNSEYRFEIT